VTHWRVSPKGIGMIMPNSQRSAIEIDKSLILTRTKLIQIEY
jgi:hypothetical protein